jgi:nucleoside-diphosphate-sugar epimerase
MNSISGRKIMITGGAGFIGHHLALSLKRQGADVEIVDSLQVNNFTSFADTSSRIENRALYMSLIQERLKLLAEAEIPVHVSDARDYHALSRILARMRPEAIVHLAAVAHANVANKDPYSTFDHSLRTLENALDVCRQFGTHFIFFSSSMVYGNFADGFVTEDSHCEPLGIYGALKFSGEKMVIAYNQVFGMPYTIVRPSALYGERCVSRRVGQVFIENALRGIQLEVAGDGSDRLDFTYVGDVVDGVCRMIEHDGARNEVFNLTYGSSRSIKNVIDVVRQHFPDLSVVYKERDKLMPSRGTLSMEKAARLIDFRPKYSIEDGFPHYIGWYKGLHAGARPELKLVS